MIKFLPFRGIRILSILLLFAIPVGAKPVAAKEGFENLRKTLATAPSPTQVHSPLTVLTEKDLKKDKLSSEWSQRARHLFDVATSQNLFKDGDLTLHDFEQAMRFISRLEKKRTKFSFFKKKDLSEYLHPDHKHLKIPIQIYDKKMAYLHFYPFDTRNKKGGYKNFSRSLEVFSGEVVANLYSVVEDAKDAKRLLAELEILRAFTGVKGLMTLRDAAVYQALISGQVTHVLAFQSSLFMGDLADARSRSLELDALLETAKQAAYALKAMHDRGYMHGDIKPANFFYKNQNENLTVVLGDFGLSVHKSSSEFGKHLSGTRGYMDPAACKSKLLEQVACSDFETCTQADTYSLGISLYELLKGTRTEISMLTHTVNNIALPKDKQNAPPPASIFGAIERLGQVHARLAPEASIPLRADLERKLHLEDLIWRLLAPDLAQRLSLTEFIQKLERLQSGQGARLAA